MNEVNIKRNILYQRKNFKQIYKEYFDEALREAAISVETSYKINRNDFITIVVEKYSDILKEVFYVSVHESMISELEECDEVILKKGYDDEINIKLLGGKCVITSMISYRLMGNYIKFIKKIKGNKLDNTSLVIVNKSLSLFDKGILKNKENKVILCDEIMDIKNRLIEFKQFYDEKSYIERVLQVREKTVIDTNFIEDSFKINIAMNYINYLSSDESKEKDTYLLANEINDESVAIYEKKANEIVEKHLNNDFEKNFFVVNKLINSIDKIGIKLYEEIIKKFVPNLEKILKEEKRSTRYLLLMKSELMNIDKLMSDELNYLNRELNYIVLEEKC